MQVILTSDGSKTLFSEEYGQTFHSVKGALTESRYVFLELSGIADRLRASRECRVLEIGFGTGLNFFLTADLALQHNAELSYVALEQNLLPASVIASLSYDDYLVNKNLLYAFLQFLRKQSLSGTVVFKYESIGLELKLGKAQNQILPKRSFDAIYQDAFSPEQNPELWSKEYLSVLRNSLKAGAKLSTYSVKGDVRRTLAEIGFLVEKKPGPPGGKREILLATLA